MALELRNVTKRVGADTHIHETSIKLEPGTFNVLLGTTLAGKTTLMQLMAGLERPTSGTIHFNGRDVTGVPVQKRNVSMVYQQFINYPNFSVFDNIASPLRVAGMSRAEIEAARRQSRGSAPPDADAEAPAFRAFGRPAAAHRHRPRTRQGLGHHPARRAARQSRLQAARGVARRAAEDFRRPQLHRRLCDDRAGRGAAVRRQHGDAPRGPGHAVRADVGDLSQLHAIS